MRRSFKHLRVVGVVVLILVTCIWCGVRFTKAAEPFETYVTDVGANIEADVETIVFPRRCPSSVGDPMEIRPSMETRRTEAGLVVCGRLVPPGAKVIDFESFAYSNPHKPEAPDFLSQHGIAEISVKGKPGMNGVLIGDLSLHKVVKGTPTSGKRFFVQTCKNPDEHSVVLTFDRPLVHFGFSRIGTKGGSSTPRWKAEAFDELGKVVGTYGEGFRVNAGPRTFDFFAPVGRRIATVTITSINNTSPGAFAWSSFSSVPLDDFVLTSVQPN